MRHVSVWSVAVVSLALYLSVLVIVLVAGIILWQLASISGYIMGARHVFTSVGFGNVVIHGIAFLMGAAGVGLVLVLICTLMTVAAAAIYNFVASGLGGFEIELGHPDRGGRPGR